MDRRRFLLTSVAGVVARPVAVEAQPVARIARVGLLLPTMQIPVTQRPAVGISAYLSRRLFELGWVEGASLVLERSAGKVVSVPVLGVVGVLVDGEKQLLALELCGGESFEAWKGCLDDLAARGLRTPMLCIIDGNAGLRRAVALVWPGAAVQRCCVHKLRNLERKAPKHALADIRDHFHRIVYAASGEAARTAFTTFERTWAKRCPGVVASLREGSDELLTFFRFPKAQWKTLRTTNTIERLHEEFRRRVKTQGSLPSEDAALVLLFSLVASGQIKLRRVDGWRKIAALLSQHTSVAPGELRGIAV